MLKLKKRKNEASKCIWRTNKRHLLLFGKREHKLTTIEKAYKYVYTNILTLK